MQISIAGLVAGFFGILGGALSLCAARGTLSSLLHAGHHRPTPALNREGLLALAAGLAGLGAGIASIFWALGM